MAIRVSAGLALFGLFRLLGLAACDGGVSHGPAAAAGGRWGSEAAGAGADTQGLSGGGGAGPAASCPTTEVVEAPVPSEGCEIVQRHIDSVSTCGAAECAITRALDLACESSPDTPWIAATTDGAVVLVATTGSGTNESLVRLLNVGAADSWVQDVAALAEPGAEYADLSVNNSAVVTDTNGAKWLFAGRAPGITLVRETGAEWTRATAIPASGSADQARLIDATVVDASLSHIVYSYSGAGAGSHYLATWDGSCWTGIELGVASVAELAVEADAEKRPWIAWSAFEEFTEPESVSIHLRSPDGSAQKVATYANGAAHHSGPLRLLPGGFDGTAALPIVAAGVDDGIVIASPREAADLGWVSQTLPESAPKARSGNCPTGDTFLGSGDPCLGLTICAQQVSGAGPGFELVRTRSGATFAAWVVYSSDGSYALQPLEIGGEMNLSECVGTEISGTGSAELIVARLTESEPILSHFRFDMGRAVASLPRSFAMTARGDTLLVAAHLSGNGRSPLTYLEIDSSLLL